MAKQQARGVAGRDALFRAAATLFAERGFHGTGMSDLERATGMGRGNIYHYVSSKDDLLYEITTRYLVELIGAGEKLLGEDLPAEERLRRFSREVVRVVVDHLPEMTVCFRDMHAVPADRRGQVLDLHRRYEAVWSDILQRGVDGGAFRTADRLAVKALLGMHHYAYLWLRPDGSLTPEQVADFFTDMVLDGVRSPG
jgi:TetR/AcrR family transcriptional regulator, cholesterol catabolism regulator